ncbi:MAG: PAS domain-containing protein [Proteobacteria bacterium]|nr:PAS domain-containing protein [Pseudomonadota bacterium]MBU1058539.1 PAS domain-containing protein [Pseudomonadota bacterium]
MKFVNLGSIGKNLTLLVMLAVLPALSIFLYTGMEQRRHSIENAKHDVLLLTHTMAEAQQNITRATRQILSTLSLLPPIQSMNILASTEIFRAVLEKNSEYYNITLTNLNGDVLASGKPFSKTNLADRKHVRAALQQKEFAAGEYIITRAGAALPAFVFAYPVLDKNQTLKAILTMAITPEHFANLYDFSTLPEKSFVAVTDHQGTRLFYYPFNTLFNPVGKPIKAKAWQTASQAQGEGIFIGKGSDGTKRIVAFQQVHLTEKDTPYIFVWAGIPEDHILAPANAALSRNLVLMLLATTMSLFISWLIGKNTFIAPIHRLIDMTRNMSRGNLPTGRQSVDTPDEFTTLTRAFLDMTDALTMGQKTLQENEARFRLLMNSLDTIVYVADMDTYEILFINEYSKKKHGDITGQICWQSIQKSQSGPCSFCTNKYLLDEKGKPGKAYTWDFQHIVTGQWFHIHDRAIKWIDDRIVRLEVATDISQAKLTETRLAEETERLAVTLRSIGDGVITTDTEGRVVLINKVAETLTGWNNEEAAGRPLAEVFNLQNKVTKDPCENPVQEILTSGEIIGMTKDTILISKNGQERNIADSGAPIRDQTGKITGIVLVFRDITKELLTEQELIKAKKLESIGVLAGGIAHDFNNILAAILGNIDLSLLDSALSPETQKLLQEAVKASNRARDLTQQLLTFAKGGEPIKEISSLTEVVKDSADFILRGDKVACRYLFSPDLWLVDIDKSQISQVVQNIILNASNAMPNGGIVEVLCENVCPASSTSIVLPQTDLFVKMEITDSGIGIPANVLDKIFDPYFSTKQKGNGLGLAITHSIVNKHGGHISVQSSPGAGTTFTIYLPASTQHSVPTKKVEKAKLSTRKFRIMVMDDEEMLRNITQEMLGRMGHKVVVAKDGNEALELYKKSMESKLPIDLTIMDLTIPGGMGGKEAVQEFLTLNAQAKVIVSSGYSNDQVMANFKDHGFCAAIAKPYQLPELRKTISQSID